MTTPTTVQVQIQLRADTAANWTAQNPTLLAAELGLETDTKKIKIGDGTTAWASLAYFPFVVSGGTVLGNLEIGTTGTLTFEGSTADGFETTLGVVNPTADRTINLPNQSGTVIVSGNASIVDNDISASAEIAVSKLADGAARQLLQTDAAGTGVEWTSNVDVPGTLDVTGAATFDAAVTIAGDLTVNGTTTNINTQNLVVEDKNVILGDVATPTDVTADGGGITLKGATDKTITWSDTTDSWELNQPTITTGSSTAASFIPTGSTVPTNGVYLSGTNTVAVATNSTGRLFVDANGLCDVQSASSSVTRIGGGSSFIVRRAETSYASPSAISASVSVGGIAARGYGGTDYRAVGNLLFSTDGAVSDVSSPGYAAISTTPSGSVTPQERLRITSTGNVGIGTTAPQALCTISNAGANGLEISPSASSGTASLIQSYNRSTSAYSILNYAAAQHVFTDGTNERARIDSSGRLLVGTISSRSIASSSAALIQTEAAVSLQYAATANRNDGIGPFFCFGKSRGTSAGSNDIVSSGDQLGTIRFAGADGTDIQSIGAAISASVDGTPGTDDMPGRLVFSTTADGASSPTERMRISNAGTTTLTSAASTAPFIANIGASEVARIDSLGRLLVGASSAQAISSLSGFEGLQVIGTGSAAGQVVGRFTDDASGASLTFSKSRGATVGTNTVAVNGDDVGVIRFSAADGTAYLEAARILAEVDGTPSANDMPGRIVLSTTADGTSSPTERMRIGNQGNIGIGAANLTNVRTYILGADTTSSNYSLYASNGISALLSVRNDGEFVTSSAGAGPYNNTTATAANLVVDINGIFKRSTSSIRYKKDVETLEDSYANNILNCRPVWYRSTANADDPSYGWWGFIAEEVAEVDPRLVFWKTKETKLREDYVKEDGKAPGPADFVEVELDTPIAEGVQYDRFVPHLVNLIKRQQQAIETLEAKVAALEGA